MVSDPDHIDALRRHAQSIGMIDSQSRVKRMAMLVFGVILALALGMPIVALLTSGALVLTEATNTALVRRITDPKTEFEPWALRYLRVNAAASTAIYLLPAVALCATGSTPLMLVGLMLSGGINLHMVARFASTPFFGKWHLIPLWIMAMVQFAFIIRSDSEHNPLAWVLCIVTVGAYVLNSLDAARMSRLNLNRLRRAERENRHRIAELEALSLHDPLTGLLNRRAFDSQLDAILANDTAPVEVIVVDLDGFKLINDTYSHAAGDTVLIDIAERLRRFVPEEALVCRMGGDEFVLAIPKPERLGNTAEKRARELLAQITAPIMWKGRRLSVHAALGSADTESAGRRREGLCANADRAMYEAKRHRDIGPVVYDPTRHRPRRTLADRQRLLDAIADREIMPYYQPKIRLTTGEHFGFEALARWRQSDGKIIYPDQFLDDISEMGLEHNLLGTMIRQIAADIERWLDAGYDPGEVALNLPQVALTNPRGADDLLAVLAQRPRAKAHMVMEITENVLLSPENDDLRRTMARLRSHGLQLSLDDFGTGFASLRHLSELPIDEIKIDRSFVSDMCETRSALASVEAMLLLARRIKLRVVAEGIESEAQRKALADLGCEIGQGFLWSQAMPPEHAILWLQRGITPPPAAKASGER